MRLSKGGWHGHCLDKVRAGTPAEGCMHYDHRVMRTPTKVLEMFLDLPTLGTAVESAALMAAYRLPRPNPKNLGVGHNWIWVKADKMDNKFSMIKDHVSLRRMFGKYQTVPILFTDFPFCLFPFSNPTPYFGLKPA